MRDLKEKFDIPLILLTLFSAAICVESYRLGVGILKSPGTGFFPLVIGFLLGGLALVRQFNIMVGRGLRDKPKFSEPLKRILPFTLSLFAYLYMMDKVGFVISTFLWIVIILKVIEHKSWKVVLLLGIGIPLGTHLLFRILLRAQLPKGFIGF